MASVRLPPIQPMMHHTDNNTMATRNYKQKFDSHGTPAAASLVVKEVTSTSSGSGTDSSSDDAENIPYHAREYARPFTYGNLPKGFKTSELNHVETNKDKVYPDNGGKVIETPTPPTTPPTMSSAPTTPSTPTSPSTPSTSRRSPFASHPPLPPASPGVSRKSMRPSISPSPPVLRKMPTREEFEEMLNERQEQSRAAMNNAKNLSIQKDLDRLYERLNRKGILQQERELERQREMERQRAKESASSPVTGKELVVRNIETIDLPDAHCDDHWDVVEASAPDEVGTSTEPVTVIAELPSHASPPGNKAAKRSPTPCFPAEPSSSGLTDDRCVSPYPLTVAVPGSPNLPRASPKRVTLASPEKSSAVKSFFGFRPQTPPAIESQQHKVEAHLVKFAKDLSDYWYMPHCTREEAVALLRNAPPGTFLIRNSSTYKNAYGLVLRVERPPPGVTVQDPSRRDELVRHFLLEPTPLGVRLKGCANEPNFSSLSAFVYQHSINQLALPCKLVLPTADLVYATRDAELLAAQRALMNQGAACNVLYLFACNTESLTGDEAIRKAVREMYGQRVFQQPIEVHFKVSVQGVTLTDNKRRRFLRQHFAAANISHFNMDPENRFWCVTANDEGQPRMVNKSIFGFVARPMGGGTDNQCHVFCDLAASQPASAIVSFANKVLPMDKHLHRML